MIQDSDVPLVISVLEELMARDGIRAALSGRSYGRLVPIIRILIENITNPRYSYVLTTVAEQIIDLYANVLGHSHEFDRLILKLKNTVVEEISLQRYLLNLGGSIDLLTSVMESS